MNILTTVKEDVKINIVFNSWLRYEDSCRLTVCVFKQDLRTIIDSF